MPNVKLEIVGQGPYIKAPDFCPYKFSDYPSNLQLSIKTSAGELHSVPNSQILYTIHPSMCVICKYCTFVSEFEESSRDPLPIQAYEREAFIKYLVEFNSKIANDILLQHKYLLSKFRTPFAIFISPTLLANMLEYCGMQETRKLVIQNIVFYKEQPLCTIVGCPVYVSRKLSRVPVQVVGEIKWK